MVRKFNLKQTLLNHLRSNNVIGWIEESELYKEDFYELFAFFAANPNISDETRKMTNELYTWYTELSNNEPFLENFAEIIMNKVSNALDKIFYDELMLLVHNVKDMIVRWNRSARAKFLTKNLYDYLEVVERNYTFDWGIQFIPMIPLDELLVDVYKLFNEYKKIISKFDLELEKKIIVNKQNITIKRKTSKARIS